MIVYDKLAAILKERNMAWRELCNCGISVNTPTKFSKNKVVSTDTIDKVCEYLQVQPYDIMEWVTQEEYEQRMERKTNKERLELEAQIAELQARLKKL